MLGRLWIGDIICLMVVWFSAHGEDELSKVKEVGVAE